jgi:MraZ protein
MFGMAGNYTHSLDAKGRIFIPAKLREELGDAFMVTISTEKCLCAYSAESWQRVIDKMRSLPFTKQKMLRPLFSHATKAELDAQGRILLPQKLRDFAGLEKNVTIVGDGDIAEFWDADTWAEIDSAETTPENLAAVFDELDF